MSSWGRHSTGAHTKALKRCKCRCHHRLPAEKWAISSRGLEEQTAKTENRTPILAVLGIECSEKPDECHLAIGTGLALAIASGCEMAPSNRSAVVRPLPPDAPRSIPDPKGKAADVENEDQPLLKSSIPDDPVSTSEVEDADVPVKAVENTLWSMKRAQGLGFIVFAGLNFSIASICIKYASHRVTSHETVFWRMIVALVLNYVSGLAPSIHENLLATHVNCTVF